MSASQPALGFSGEVKSYLASAKTAATASATTATDQTDVMMKAAVAAMSLELTRGIGIAAAFMREMPLSAHPI